MSLNTLELIGEVVQIETLRYTPAGIPLLSFTLRHMSEQVEAGMQRKVECNVPVMAIGQIAEKAKHIQSGANLRVSGFIAQRSLKSTQLVLHINILEII
ncbi:primosomal replication protein N [Methylovorus sp. MM2]|uniref:primosomal replication protein N n=1 Tax=Methylovorus sp. MM2 TaxID=1848038 RepID=UPI0007DF2162|nr:primosomal replication protein N [Methylovorus sp. MM2]OAM52962.1 primosomal replication protein N [Methylovorus sp. MM2]